MVAQLPVELIQSLRKSCPCRDDQLRQLAILYNNSYPFPSSLVLYGIEGTSKFKAISSVLAQRKITFAVVNARECLSQRHLLTKVFSVCVTALGRSDAIDQYDKIDNLNSVLFNLQKLFERRQEKFVLVFDGIDKQRGGSATLLPTLARLGDIINNLSIILISSSPRPLLLHRTGIHHVYFPPFSRIEAITLITASPPPLRPAAPNSSHTSIDASFLTRTYAQFATAVYDSLLQPTAATSLPVFRSTCLKLWPRFIWPYVSLEPPPARAKSWDFARLLVRNRALFQIDGETALTEGLRPTKGPWTFSDLEALRSNTPGNPSLPPTTTTAAVTITKPTISPPPLLKFFPTLLLISSYLASHTSAKLDILLFSRLSSGSKTHRQKKSYQRKKLLATTPTKPSSSAAGANTTTTTTRAPSRANKARWDGKMGLARPFALERAVAVLRAIHPAGVPRAKGVADKVAREMSELERLRLVVRVVGGGGGAGAGEDAGALAAEDRWRVNVRREWVEAIARRWGVGWAEYEIERENV